MTTAPATARRVLPQRRACTTFDVKHKTETGDQAYSISIGYFDDGSPAEVFVNGPKVGSGVEAIARDGAVMISIAMQFGVPLDVLRSAVTRDRNNGGASILGAVLDLLGDNQT